MSIYHSGFSDSVESFVKNRKISDAWNETVFGLNIRLFDRYCAKHYPGESLRQEMVDIWCSRRETENVNSCYTRTLVIRLFIEHLRKRGQTGIVAPPLLKQNAAPVTSGLCVKRQILVATNCILFYPSKRK